MDFVIDVFNITPNSWEAHLRYEDEAGHITLELFALVDLHFTSEVEALATLVSLEELPEEEVVEQVSKLNSTILENTGRRIRSCEVMQIVQDPQPAPTKQMDTVITKTIDTPTSQRMCVYESTLLTEPLGDSFKALLATMDIFHFDTTPRAWI